VYYRVVERNPKKRGGIGIERELSEKAEQVFSVEFNPVKSSGDIHSALDLPSRLAYLCEAGSDGVCWSYIWCEQCGVDAFGLGDVVWIHELREEGILHIPQLLERKFYWRFGTIRLPIRPVSGPPVSRHCPRCDVSQSEGSNQQQQEDRHAHVFNPSTASAAPDIFKIRRSTHVPFFQAFDQESVIAPRLDKNAHT
jgi:hypothetical protein